MSLVTYCTRYAALDALREWKERSKRDKETPTDEVVEEQAPARQLALAEANLELARLAPRDREVLRARIVGDTLAQVGKRLGLSRGHLCRIEHEALDTLQRSARRETNRLRWLEETREVQVPTFQVQQIPVDGVGYEEWRERTVHDGTVNALASDYGDLGQYVPIIVDTHHHLICGMHRLTAAKARGDEKIFSVIVDGLSEAQTKRLRAAENLRKAPDDFARLAWHHGIAKEAYEEEHPETKHGGDRSRSHGEILAYVDWESQRSGISRATVGRYLSIYAGIPQDALLSLWYTPVAKRLGDLLSLAKLDRDEQDELVAQLTGADPAPTLADARKSLGLVLPPTRRQRPEPPPAQPVVASADRYQAAVEEVSERLPTSVQSRLPGSGVTDVAEIVRLGDYDEASQHQILDAIGGQVETIDEAAEFVGLRDDGIAWDDDEQIDEDDETGDATFSDEPLPDTAAALALDDDEGLEAIVRAVLRLTSSADFQPGSPSAADALRREIRPLWEAGLIGAARAVAKLTKHNSDSEIALN